MRKGRLYQVRLSLAADFPAWMMSPQERRDEAARGGNLTIWRIDGSRLIVSAPPSWRDTDQWASSRWRTVEANGRRLDIASGRRFAAQVRR